MSTTPHVPGPPQPQPHGLRLRLFEIMEGGGDSRAAKACDAFFVTLILLNMAAFVAETVPRIEARYGWWLRAFELVSVLIFTVEYALRLWTAVEMPTLRRLSPLRARLKLAATPALIIDLLAFLPFYFGSLLGLDLRILRILRLLRFLKLTRYSPAIHTLMRVLTNERRSLMGACLLLLAALLFTATGMYYIEGGAYPDKFGTIPDAAYWAMTTLTTVGYGDVVPMTPAGKLWAMMTMVLGLCILSLPVAIIAAGFAQEVGRREFIVNWSLMSRIPLFAELDATQVADIMPLLHAKDVPAHFPILRPEDAGKAMFFIASGEVHTRGASPERAYASGDFFGVVAMLENTEQEFEFITTTRSRLLKLDRADFQRLDRSIPFLGDHLRRIAARRLAVRTEAFRKSAIPPA